ncbi:hypothetical protein J6590_005550 [Homalodisca vitripennis]|nr:hypothetical protein J6590_005550 [Homalodisca vitripennis]
MLAEVENIVLIVAFYRKSHTLAGLYQSNDYKQIRNIREDELVLWFGLRGHVIYVDCLGLPQKNAKTSRLISFIPVASSG